MKTLVKKMLFACAFPVLFFLCLFSCADSLNEKNPEKSEELVEAGGISWPKEDSSSLVHNCSTGYFSDMKEISVKKGTSVSYNYTVKSGYCHYIMFYDSSNSYMTSYCSENGKTAGSASIEIYNSSNSLVASITSSTNMSMNETPSGTFKMVITPSSSGVVFLYVYQIPLASTLDSSATLTVSSYDYALWSAFIKAKLTSGTSANYKFYATRGKTYTIHFIDADIGSGNVYGVPSSRAYAFGQIYNSDGSWSGADLLDEDEWVSFTPESSGYYVVSLQKEGSQLDDGYAGFWIYSY